jgi:hypothetical protein
MHVQATTLAALFLSVKPPKVAGKESAGANWSFSPEENGGDR